MPTQRFLNLKDSKKNAILEAAAHEFARVPTPQYPLTRSSKKPKYPEEVSTLTLKTKTT